MLRLDKHPLITQKRADSELFKQVPPYPAEYAGGVYRIDSKQRTSLFFYTNEGIQKIVRIKVSMNLGLSDSLKVLFAPPKCNSSSKTYR
jgi:hypothetical protein